MLTEKTVNLIKRAVKAGNTSPTIAQLKTLATAIGDAESYKALNTATIHDIIDIKKKCALFGKDKPDKVSDGKGNLFGLEGKDTTIASEKQEKIYDVKPMEKPDIEMKNIAERKKVEEFHPDTSDRKVETKTVSEPLKEKAQFPEVLNRGEKQQKEIAKETKASKKRAWTEDESDVTPIARQVMDINADTWVKNGWEDGSMVKMDVLKEALKDIAPQVTQADLDVLEDYNNHSAYQAITELNPKARTSSKVASPQFPTHLEESLLDGFSIQELIDTVIHNEPTRDPQAVQRVFEEMLDFSVQNANETLNSELPMILSEISDYEKRGSKTAAENPFEKKPDKGEKVEKPDKPEKAPDVEKPKEVPEKKLEPKEDKLEKPKEDKEPKIDKSVKELADKIIKPILEKLDEKAKDAVLEFLSAFEKGLKEVSKAEKTEKEPKNEIVKEPKEVPAVDIAPKAPAIPKVSPDAPKEAKPLPVKPVEKLEPKINPVKKLIQSLQKVLADFAQGDVVELADTGAQVTVDSMGKDKDGKAVLVGKDTSGNVITVPEGTQVKQNTEIKPVM